MVNTVKSMVGYEKKIFAFIDILGFGELIEMSKKQPTMVSEIRGLLNVSKQMAKNIVGRKVMNSKVDLDKFVFHSFSDTVTISCPLESHDYFNIMSATIMSYQYTLWSEKGIFIRGGVAYGDLYEESDIVFGSVVIDAYRLENTAQWPRVLFDESVLNELSDEEKARDFAEHLYKDDDGSVCLD
jgi:hypothetical protein